MVTEGKSRIKNAVPIIPYLRLSESGNFDPYLIGNRCQKCGEVYLGKRDVCIKCYAIGHFDEVKLSRTGTVYTFTVINQSVPWVKVPYVAAVVQLPEGPLIRTTLTGVEPDTGELKVGMPVEMYTETVRQDKDGVNIVTYKFRPSKSMFQA